MIDRLFDKDTVISTPIVQIRHPGRDTLNVRLFKSANRWEYLVRLFFSGGGDSTPEMRVVYTYGGRGWIERFVVDINGRYYVPPLQYILPAYKVRSDSGGAFYFLDFNRWLGIDSRTGEGVFFDFASTKFNKRTCPASASTNSAAIDSTSSGRY